VRVTVDFGAVVLSGTADSIAQRGLLADVVSRVRGVEGVTMTGVTLSHASSRADAELEADVGDELRDDARLDGTSVQAAVHGKDAVLSGVVGSLAQRDAASADAWSAGVASVDAHAVRIDWTAVGRATSADRRPPPSDPQIAAAVRRRLERDVRVGDQLPSVDVAQGAVTLAGNVADFRADGAAIGDARSVSGVWRVEDAMRVAPARRESDALIQEQVLSGIYEDVAAPDSRSVRVLTSNGKVTLRGAVASQEDKKVIEDDVEEVPGVAALDDQLVVRGNSPQTTVVATGSLAHLVTEDIFWDPRIAQDDTITVAAAPNGDVTLAGHVESTREARAANDDAIRAGAAHVIDHIEVVNVPP
jgi:osmotically-inducible protein OsmY